MRLSRERIVVFAVLALLFGAGLAVAATGRERNEAVYPAQIIPLSFSHEQHFKADVECDACHDPANKSIRSSDRLLPGHPECDSCHDIEKATEDQPLLPPSACSPCPRGFDQAAHT